MDKAKLEQLAGMRLSYVEMSPEQCADGEEALDAGSRVVMPDMDQARLFVALMDTNTSGRLLQALVEKLDVDYANHRIENGRRFAHKPTHV